MTPKSARSEFEKWFKKYFGMQWDSTAIGLLDFKTYHIKDAFNYGLNAGRRVERRKIQADHQKRFQNYGKTK